jgi:hypothetical protein
MMTPAKKPRQYVVGRGETARLARRDSEFDQGDEPSKRTGKPGLLAEPAVGLLARQQSCHLRTCENLGRIVVSRLAEKVTASHEANGRLVRGQQPIHRILIADWRRPIWTGQHTQNRYPSGSAMTGTSGRYGQSTRRAPTDSSRLISATFSSAVLVFKSTCF